MLPPLPGGEVGPPLPGGEEGMVLTVDAAVPGLP